MKVVTISKRSPSLVNDYQHHYPITLYKKYRQQQTAIADATSLQKVQALLSDMKRRVREDKDANQDEDNVIYWNDEASTNNVLINIVTSLGVDVGVELSIVMTKKILKRTAQWLSTRAVSDLIAKLGNKILARIGVGAVTRMIATDMALKAMVGAIGAASAILTGVGIVLLLFAIFGFIYDLVDIHGFSEMLNKEEVDAFVRGSRVTFLQNLQKNFPGLITTVPPVVTPSMLWEKSGSSIKDIVNLSDLKNETSPNVVMERLLQVKHTDAVSAISIYLEESIRYTNNLKVNSQGQIIDLKNSHYPNLPELPTTPNGWHRMIGDAYSRTIDYQVKFRQFTDKLSKTSYAFGTLGLLYAILT